MAIADVFAVTAPAFTVPRAIIERAIAVGAEVRTVANVICSLGHDRFARWAAN
jgi:hypothetical protein